SSSGELRGMKFTEWEGGVRAPAIIKWPNGFKGAKTTNQVMGYIDVMPTLLDITGVDIKIQNKLDGISMLDVLTGKKSSIDRNFFLGSGAIVNNDWKLIEASDRNPRMKFKEDQFFHISKDASEKED